MDFEPEKYIRIIILIFLIIIFENLLIKLVYFLKQN